jgi:hypothetical protein
MPDPPPHGEAPFILKPTLSFRNAEHGAVRRSDDDLLEKCVNRGFPYLTASGASLAIHVLRSGAVLLTLEHVAGLSQYEGAAMSLGFDL